MRSSSALFKIVKLCATKTNTKAFSNTLVVLNIENYVTIKLDYNNLINILTASLITNMFYNIL